MGGAEKGMPDAVSTKELGDNTLEKLRKEEFRYINNTGVLKISVIDRELAK